MNQEQQRLADLYKLDSKHANYQAIPPCLTPYLTGSGLMPKSRHEQPRLDFIQRHVEISHRHVLDIGANIGFFSLELLSVGAAFATLYEGNQAHAQFAELAGKILGLENRMAVNNDYFDTGQTRIGSEYDFVLLMNVLHHLGDDYGEARNIAQTKKHIVETLIQFDDSARCLIFQLGYNWKGNPALPLFEHGTKAEQIDFVTEAIGKSWKIEAIGIPEIIDGKTVYCQPTRENLARRDELGEFLNRPLFILNR